MHESSFIFNEWEMFDILKELRLSPRNSHQEKTGVSNNRLLWN